MRLILSLLTLFLAGQVFWTVGCSGREDLKGISPDRARKVASRMNNEELRKRTAEYVALIRQDRTDLARLHLTILETRPETATESEIHQLQERRQEIEKEIAELVMRYQVFYSQMVRRGLPTEDVQID